MYGWIWRKLPFGLPGKIIGSLLLVGIMLWLLWYHVFPAAEPLLPFDDVQVENPGGPNQPGDADLVSPEPSGEPGSGELPGDSGTDGG
ncbi:MAG: hypothetical protein ACRDTU_15230 [Micromonosporaceae bacterium]